MHHPGEALPDDEGEDLVIQPQDEPSLICPITKTLLQEPVKKCVERIFLRMRLINAKVKRVGMYIQKRQSTSISLLLIQDEEQHRVLLRVVQRRSRETRLNKTLKQNTN